MKNAITIQTMHEQTQLQFRPCMNWANNWADTTISPGTTRLSTINGPRPQLCTLEAECVDTKKLGSKVQIFHRPKTIKK